MIYGIFHNHLPRIPIDLPTAQCASTIEFVLDTGNEGELSLPSVLMNRIDSQPLFSSLRAMADGSVVECPVRQVMLDWFGEERLTEVIVLENPPLAGTILLDQCYVEIQLREGAHVVVTAGE